MNWKFKDVKKKLTFNINKCIGCDLCKLVCPVDAIELGPIPEIAQGIISEENPKILINEDCMNCMLCVIVCPNDAFHDYIEPEGQINLEEFPSIGKFYEINEKNCVKDDKNPICLLCLESRKGNHIRNYFNIQKECPTNCFKISSPIQGEVIIKKNMLHKCTPENCKACINICPTESFFIPESAEEVLKYGKIACNEDECFYCGACENSCPEDLIVVKRKKVKLIDPLKKGTYPWITGWVKKIKDILRKRLIYEKLPFEIPLIEEEIEVAKKKIEEKIPQLSEAERNKLSELNDKIQNFLKSSKIRYWIKDKKTEKIVNELKKILD